jgi:hypothetical protein
VSLTNSVNLIISLENKIPTTNKAKKNNDSMQKMNACQYYRNISSQYSKNISMILWCGPTQKHQQGPITCSKWSNDLVQDKGIERGIACIGFECFNQVRIERSIRVSRGDPSTSYPCVRGVQHNLIWAMRWGNKKNPSTTWKQHGWLPVSFCF